MVSYNYLYFNRVTLLYDGSQISLAPNFRCPVCDGRPDALLTQTWNIPVNRELDVNTPVTFTMPCCQSEIHLYLAVVKQKNSMTIHCHVSTEPILDDWVQLVM